MCRRFPDTLPDTLVECMTTRLTAWGVSSSFSPVATFGRKIEKKSCKGYNISGDHAVTQRRNQDTLDRIFEPASFREDDQEYREQDHFYPDRERKRPPGTGRNQYQKNNSKRQFL